VDARRRTVLGAGLVVGAGGCSAGSSTVGQQPQPKPRPAPRRQPGVADPAPRQRYAALQVLDLAPGTDARTLLARLGDRVAALGAPDGLTVTVAVGPAVVRATAGEGVVGATDLPRFATDAIEDDAEGGDLLLQVCADRRPTVRRATAGLVARLGDGVRPRWSAEGYRGEVEGTATRNVLGFHDGVAVPHTPAELDEAVWTDASDGLADATVCVVRRIRLDHRRFGLLPVAEQEAVIGRRRRTGAPLSGGTIDDDVDLQAKSDAGVYDIPVDAHVRRAHPLPSGAGALMLRRGYSYRAGPDDQGLLFVSFQRDLDVFVRTQHSMEGGDRLLEFATTTGSGTFLVLPAAAPGAPLGAALDAAGPA
jgi:dye decolorizing peroxidase